MDAASYYRIKNVVDQKKTKDTSGFQKAQRENKLKDFLRLEFVKAGLNPSSDIIDKYLNDQIPLLIRFDFFLNDIYEDIYSKYPQSFDTILSLQVVDDLGLQQLKNELLKPKLFFAASGLLLSLLTVKYVTAGSTASLICGLLSFDCFKLSYNCFYKKYCSLVYETHFGSTRKSLNTVLSWSQQALGISDNKNSRTDYSKVSMKIILQNSTVFHLYKWVSYVVIILIQCTAIPLRNFSHFFVFFSGSRGVIEKTKARVTNEYLLAKALGFYENENEPVHKLCRLKQGEV